MCEDKTIKENMAGIVGPHFKNQAYHSWSKELRMCLMPPSITMASQIMTGLCLFEDEIYSLPNM